MRREVPVAAPVTAIAELARLMVEHRVPGVPILENNQLVGIVTEADLIEREATVDFPEVATIFDAVIYADTGSPWRGTTSRVGNDRKRFNECAGDQYSRIRNPLRTGNFDDPASVNPVPVVDEERRIIGSGDTIRACRGHRPPGIYVVADDRAVRVCAATRAYVDLDAIEENVRVVRRHLPDHSQIMAIVKADGYGHGAPWVAEAALRGGASATWRSDRQGRPRAPTASASPLPSWSWDRSSWRSRARLSTRGLEIAVGDTELLDAVATSGQLRRKSDATCGPSENRHRYAPLWSVIVVVYIGWQRISADHHLRLAGVFTHFASADEPEDAFTGASFRCFVQCLAHFRRRRILPCSFMPRTVLAF